MTKLINDPDDFANEALAGFVSLHSDVVQPVNGGVVRARHADDGHVAVVMGGGSGHFPAFAGWVGQGLAHGAVCGNTFASPSERQVVDVARAAHRGGGVLLLPINYAGDILHFSAAAETLRREGIAVELLAISDDMASAPPEARHERRGIAGSLIVAKLVGAAAERGESLDAVVDVARRANEVTSTLGVGLSGCTLPGSASPLFEVPTGRVAVGLGIHGEPGIAEEPLGSANDVADMLTDAVLAERQPCQGQPVAILVNGLGSTTYDELHVVFARVQHRLSGAGLRLVAPLVGEFVSSLDMAGLSVSMTVLDDRLTELWLDPADTPCFRRGAVGASPSADAHERTGLSVGEDAADERVTPAASSASQAVAARIATALKSVGVLLREQEAKLGAIDAVAGDGDHGMGMRRGAAAAADAAAIAAASGAGAGTTLHRAGEAWSDVGGGTSGALWAAGLIAAGLVVTDRRPPTRDMAGEAVEAFAAAIAGRGGAVPGDKTMVDAIAPFVEVLTADLSSGRSLSDAWRGAVEAAEEAARSTERLVSKRGRSRLHGARSLGTPDAGATSFALIVRELAGSLGATQTP